MTSGRSPHEKDRAEAVHRWVRMISEPSTACSERSLDLTLNVMTAILAGPPPRGGGSPPRGGGPAFRAEGVKSLADLVPVAEALDPDLARDLASACARPVPALDRAVADVWRQAADPAFSGRGGEVLGFAYECILAAGDPAAGRRTRRLTGVFYTPPEIVEYIVARTLGRRRSERDECPTVLDPACGSGAFLQGASACLRRNRPADSAARLAGRLEASIYGVDTDERAVRLARINLRLAWAGRGRGSGGLRLGEVLKRRIVAGSALDEPGERGPVISVIERSFPEVIEQGGFDFVIGNPPYVKNRDLDAGRKRLWKETYVCARGQYDLMVLFLERGMDLLKPGGRLGFLVTNKFMTADYGRALRERILDSCRIEQVVDLSRARLFHAAAIYPTILILRKGVSRSRPRGSVLLRDGVVDLADKSGTEVLPQSFFDRRPGRILMTAIGRSTRGLLERIEDGARTLGEVASVECGLADARMGRTLLRSRGAADAGTGTEVLPFIRVENIRPYEVHWSGRWVALSGARCSPHRLNRFRAPKIVVPGVRPGLQAAYDDRGYALGRVYYLAETALDERLLLALLNSRVLDWYYRSVFGAARMAGGFLRFNGPYLKALPVPSNPPDGICARIVDRVGDRLHLGRRLERTARTRARIARLERDIDRLVCDLYSLTEDERSVVSA